MGCKICWKRLKPDKSAILRCSDCPDGEPWPRLRISVHAVNIESNGDTEGTFAEFVFFGAQGEQIARMTTECAAAYATGRANYSPPELEQLPGKSFIVTVTPHQNSLDSDLYHLRVRALEQLDNQEALPLLPMANQSETDGTAGSSSSSPPIHNPTDKNILATPASSEDNRDETPHLEKDRWLMHLLRKTKKDHEKSMDLHLLSPGRSL